MQASSSIKSFLTVACIKASVNILRKIYHELHPSNVEIGPLEVKIRTGKTRKGVVILLPLHFFTVEFRFSLLGAHKAKERRGKPFHLFKRSIEDKKARQHVFQPHTPWKVFRALEHHQNKGELRSISPSFLDEHKAEVHFWDKKTTK